MSSVAPQLLPSGDAPLTVACVYRSGSKMYSTDYVRVLRDMVARNLTRPHRFVCLSDVEVPCERIPLTTGWPGFYAKLEMFRPGLFPGPVLYFDLDTIIHGNIDDLADLARSVAFGCASDPKGGHFNSSIMAFSGDFSFVYERFRKTGSFERHVRSHVWFALSWIKLGHLVQLGSSYGDQGFSEMCLKERGIAWTFVDKKLPGQFSTFNYGAGPDAEPPGGRVCLMMGRPKPHEIKSGWVTEHWR